MMEEMARKRAEETDALAEICRVLECVRAEGERRVYLRPETLQGLWTDAVSAEATAAARPSETPVASDTRTVVSTASSASGDAVASPHEIGSAAPETLDWEALRQAVEGCTLCPLCKTRTNTVFGEGDPDADLMFIGEGPGAEEDAQGRPFVGRAGQLLTKMIQAMQFTREEVFIGNIVKCRPPNNRVPEKLETEHCLPYLRRQIELIRPRVIVLLGSTPLKHLLGMTGITRLHGQWLDYKGIAVMPSFHPSFLLRDPRQKAPAWEDLKQVMIKLGKDPAETRSQK